MVRQIKTIPFHTFLLPVFFILHILNEYYGLLSGGIVLRYFGWYFLLSIVFFGIGRMLLKSNHKAALLSTVLLAIFFFWGAFHDYIKELGIAGFLTSYSFLLPLYGVLFVVFYILLRRMKNLTRITFFFNLLFVLFISITLIQIAGKAFSRTDINDLAAQNPPLPIKQQLIPDSLKPDIFFIVFDEYASSLALKKYFNFDNTPLDSVMRRNGFYIVNKSKSNYNATPLSIGSTFNMGYFKRKYEGEVLDALEIQKAWYSINKSLLPLWLIQNGYKTSYFTLDTTGHITRSKFTNLDQNKVLYNQTLASRIKRDLIWNFIKNNQLKTSYSDSVKIFSDIKRIKYNYRNFSDGLRKSTNEPRFVYAHLFIPHHPYYIDSIGNLSDKEMLNESDGYLQQIKYSSLLIKQLVEIANKPRSRPLVLIIEGDHGFRGDTPIRSEKETAFMNLNAFYFSDGDYKLLYDDISPVNTFRIVLNKYFKQELPLLKDTTVSLHVIF